MSETTRDDAMLIQVRRMLNARILLCAFLFFNFLLVAAVPFARPSRDGSTDPEKTVADGSDSITDENPAQGDDPVAPRKDDTTNGGNDSIQDDPGVQVETIEPKSDDGNTGTIVATDDPDDPTGLENSFDYAPLEAIADEFFANAMGRSHVSTTQFTQQSSHVLSRFAARLAKQKQKPQPATLVLFNPEETRGQVHYVVDGVVHTLQPGETHDLGDGDTWHIQFHRGNDFGNAEYFLSTGQYRFHVTKDGWELSAESL